jgi:hypothetical protein
MCDKLFNGVRENMVVAFPFPANMVVALVVHSAIAMDAQRMARTREEANSAAHLDFESGEAFAAVSGRGIETETEERG